MVIQFCRKTLAGLVLGRLWSTNWLSLGCWWTRLQVQIFRKWSTSDSTLQLSGRSCCIFIHPCTRWAFSFVRFQLLHIHVLCHLTRSAHWLFQLAEETFLYTSYCCCCSKRKNGDQQISYLFILYCTILHCTVLYYTVLYYTILYCTTLYCTIKNKNKNNNNKNKYCNAVSWTLGRLLLVQTSNTPIGWL